MTTYPGRHSLQTQNHRLESWIYADATARLAATGFTVDDVGRIAYQQSDTSYWRLSDDAPVTWAAVVSAAGMANPMTTAGDLIVGGTSGAPARLGPGAAGQVLTVDPATHLLIWRTPTVAGLAVPRSFGWYLDGDVVVASGSGPIRKLDTNLQFNSLEMNVKVAGVGDTKVRLYSSPDRTTWVAVGDGTQQCVVVGGTSAGSHAYTSTPQISAGSWIRLDIDEVGSTPTRHATVEVFGQLY